MNSSAGYVPHPAPFAILSHHIAFVLHWAIALIFDAWDLHAPLPHTPSPLCSKGDGAGEGTKSLAFQRPPGARRPCSPLLAMPAKNGIWSP